jgi:hypothetical protein
VLLIKIPVRFLMQTVKWTFQNSNNVSNLKFQLAILFLNNRKPGEVHSKFQDGFYVQEKALEEEMRI